MDPHDPSCPPPHLPFNFKRKKNLKCLACPTGGQARLQVGQAVLFQPPVVGPLSVQSLLQPVVHLPAGGREVGQVQRPGHAAGLQRPPEDEDHRSGGAGRGNVLWKTQRLVGRWSLRRRVQIGFCNTEICRSHNPDQSTVIRFS